MLKDTLDRLYASFDSPDSASDPIQIVRRFDAAADREVAGFVAAALAFGRVESVKRSIQRVLDVTGPAPGAYVRDFDPRRDARAYAAVFHRWIRGADLAALMWLLRQMIDRAGSIESFFAAGLDPADEDIGPALDRFCAAAMALDVRSRGVSHFFPRPSGGSACKRLNLFLRWMVRRDAHDLGVWTRVPAAKLVIPLDTHIVRVGKLLRLTRYASPGWPMAREITAALRRVDPEDPVKYDFALCHLSMEHPRPSELRRFLRSGRPSARR